MEKIKLQVSGSQIQVIARPAAITAGTVGLEVEFSFDSHWDNLGKTVIFRAGDAVITAGLERDTHIVPWEVLVKPDLWLVVGIYGANPEGTVVIPTLWTKVAAVYTGADPEGDPALEPSNPIWQETLARVSNMEPQLSDHINNADNPHNVTCDQIGAVTQKEFYDVVSNLDGSSDDSEQWIPHLLNRDNPHGVTAAQAGAAPAGYGLGEENANTTLWYNIDRSGFYSAVSGSPDGSRWTGLNVNRNKVECYQLAFRNMNEQMVEAIRMRSPITGWKEWEYVNPPMLEGVEYRTTERWKGQVVYTKRVSYTTDAAIGSDTSGVDTNIPHGISGFGSLVRVNCCKGTYPFPYLKVNGGFTTINEVNAQNIVLRNYKMTWNAATWQFDLYYTKA